MIIVKAKPTLLATDLGGRKTGFQSGYRPDHVFEYSRDGGICNAFMGDIVVDPSIIIQPGDDCIVKVRFLPRPALHEYLEIGRVWWIHEGHRCIGECEILELLSEV